MKHIFSQSRTEYHPTQSRWGTFFHHCFHTEPSKQASRTWNKPEWRRDACKGWVCIQGSTAIRKTSLHWNRWHRIYNTAELRYSNDLHYRKKKTRHVFHLRKWCWRALRKTVLMKYDFSLSLKTIHPARRKWNKLVVTRKHKGVGKMGITLHNKKLNHSGKAK